MGEIERAFGRRLKQLRLKKGLTQEDLSRLAKLDYKFIGQLEGGKGVTLRTVGRMAEALEVPVKALFEGAPNPRVSGRAFRSSVLVNLISGLDPATQSHFIRLIRHLQRIAGKSAK